MDMLDRRILREVQRDSSLSARELAERCRTTESTALRRLKQLRQDRVICAEVAVVDPARIGRNLLLFVRVSLERENGGQVKSFTDRIAAHPDVLQFYFVTGSTDYIIMLCVRSMADYDRFLQQHLVPDPHVVMSDTNVVIRQIKMTTAVPIDEPDC